MPHGLLEILKYFLLALLWLFFIYAARTVLVDVKRSRPEHDVVEDKRAEERQRRPRHAFRLRVLEPADQRGGVFDVAGDVTLGRSAACSISLDYDAFASSVHARVFQHDGELWLEDLGSTNGTFLNDERLKAPVRLRRGDHVKVGGTVLEVGR